ncbi:histidine biosynthesis bifunctional protein (HISIE) [Tasmannia lanceolata]|uniref:histidine biosynthesis bifunctional protein (HISIE) n=1 Tax=Tasmannia lanceolata TaxID=3420 RepID=UPI004064B8A1
MSTDLCPLVTLSPLSTRRHHPCRVSSTVFRFSSSDIYQFRKPSISIFHENTSSRHRGRCSVLCQTARALSKDSSDASNAGQHRLSKVELLLDSVKWDNKGLAVAIAQNVETGAILMQGFANREALAATISSRKATFYSRSRSSLWTKGETSMNFINVHDIFLDCDRDSILYLGKPDGPACHTGSETCYFSSVSDSLKDPQANENQLALTTLYSLESTISQRKDEIGEIQNGKPSWTKRLLLDEKLLCSKIREEANELCRTLEDNEDKSRTASEMGDVIYHSMVLLAVKGVKMEEVLEVLRKRFALSGIEEKNSRKSGNSTRQ